MRMFWGALAGTLFCSAAAGGVVSDNGLNHGGLLALETFEQEQPRVFPSKWKARGDDAEAAQIYRVAEEDGNRFLRARSVRQGVQVGLAFSFVAKSYPVLGWRWRASRLPAGADESVKRSNDSAAGVYVIFDGRIVPRVIKYIWSSSLPVGTSMRSPHYGWAKLVVLRSGPPRNGDWCEERVNIYEDYRRLFEREPGEVQGIGLLTDSDDTNTRAEADYDDFVLFPADETASEPGPLPGLTRGALSQAAEKKD